MSSDSDRGREGVRAHYATKAQLTKAYLGLVEPNRGPEDRSVSAVLPGLFLSGRGAEFDASLLHSLGISHVLQARGPASSAVIPMLHAPHQSLHIAPSFRLGSS
jgi:hypothetical protein